MKLKMPAVTARAFVGGPLHGEIIAVNAMNIGYTVPLKTTERRDPDIPEWAVYKVNREEDMVFLGRVTSIDAAIQLSMDHDAQGGTS